MSYNFLLDEKNQSVRTLAVVIWIVLVASVALGLLNITYGTWHSVIALFGLALICVPLLWLNAKGHYVFSASILSIFILLVITLNMVDGDGIHDSGLLAYPMFIAIGILFFGKRATPYFGLAAIASLIGIVYLEMHGYVHPTIGKVRFDILLPIIILLLASSALMWVVVENIEMHLERARDSEAELRKNYQLTLEAWAKLLEYKDRETEGHSRRVVELSTRLAKAVGLSEVEITNLRRGALLHDIGKLAIPDEILLKRGELNDAERKLVEQHPLIAKQMLSEISFLQPCIDIPSSHHERWDGLGYPNRLKGQEIPLSARIFTVIDQWDALTSDRPYRRAWTREEVIAYMQENAGKIYDPEIVNIFLSII
jgi:putative nucleotidyltransferase with HDIG domain